MAAGCIDWANCHSAVHASVADVLLQVDMAFQYGEDNEVKIRDHDPEEDADMDDGGYDLPGNP